MTESEKMANDLVKYLDEKGLIVVPKEPTEKMIDAGVAMALQVSVNGQGGWSNYVSALYKQMLSQAYKNG